MSGLFQAYQRQQRKELYLLGRTFSSSRLDRGVVDENYYSAVMEDLTIVQPGNENRIQLTCSDDLALACGGPSVYDRLRYGGLMNSKKASHRISDDQPSTYLKTLRRWLAGTIGEKKNWCEGIRNIKDPGWAA